MSNLTTTAKGELRSVEATPAESVESLIRLAIEHDQSPTELYRILGEERERRAKGEFTASLAQLQHDCPELQLSRRVGRDGGLQFDYAPLETILETLRPIMAENGMSMSWSGRTYSDGNQTIYESTAILTHVSGYEHRCTFSAPVNLGQKGLQPDQCVARTATLCDRNALIRGLGLRAGVPSPVEQGLLDV